MLPKDEALRLGLVGIRKGTPNPNAAKSLQRRVCLVMPDGDTTEFESVNQAAKSLGIHSNTVTRSLTQGTPLHKGLGKGGQMKYTREG